MKLFSKSGIAMGLVAAATAMLTACGGGGDDGIDDRLGLNEPQVRVMHVVPADIPVNVYQNGAKTSLQNIPYKFVARYSDVDDGNQLFSFRTPVNNAEVEIGSVTVDAATGHKYTLAVMPTNPPGNGANVVVIDDPYDKGLISDKARVRALNAAANAANIDVYVTAPNADISGMAPTFANVGYAKAIPASGQDSLELEGGDYQIRITTAGTKDVIFNSGQVNLGDNADWLITALPVENLSSVVTNNIKVLVAKANDDSQTAIELTDQP